eukprot:CAMPEP_0201570564 /NCGR_PEP_ID=MMETSP0190_2-20130828/12865_1 /ASSEMBLY_ACC=CAM_ASM_000263 /TAXON_ID=37353 /ORGANISM="Rosalina sp." /LENGTH=770 /DNA_ID=CAMNT_0047994219 /DNA_START=93 /DNA_END=2405 /DNA_ORIENTATION=-
MAQQLMNNNSSVGGINNDTITDDIDNDNESKAVTYENNNNQMKRPEPIENIKTNLDQIMDNDSFNDDITDIHEHEGALDINYRNVSVDTDHQSPQVIQPQYSKQSHASPSGSVIGSEINTPIFTPQQSISAQNKVVQDEDDDKKGGDTDNIYIEDDLQRTCAAIGEWYFMMNNNNDYYDNNGDGIFTKYFENQKFPIDEMSDEFEEKDYLGCGYLEFHMDSKTDTNLFPLSNHIKHHHRKQIIFQILSHCFKTGKAPNIHSMTANKVYLKSYEDDGIKYDVDDEMMCEAEQFYNKLCPQFSQKLFQQDDLREMLSIGYQNNVNLLSILTDIFMRDRLDELVSNQGELVTPPPIQVSDWAEKNKYIQHLVKRYNKKLGDIMKSSIDSYGKRIVPRFPPMQRRKIMDDLTAIFRYFKAATQFIHKLLVDGSKHHKDGGYNISNAPFQFDFCIAVAECTHELELETMPSMGGDSDDSFAEEMENYAKQHEMERQQKTKYFDLIGDIKKKFKDNNYNYTKEEFDPDKYMTIDHKSMSFVRCFMEIYNKFIQKYEIRKDKFPKGSRLCCLIDRRKKITKFKKFDGENPNNDTHFQFDRNKDGNKKDDMYLWIPKKYDKIENKSGYNEIYHETISEELIPKINATTMNYGDTDQNIKYKPLREAITSETKQLNGGLLIFSFQINAEDEIACYLWHQGKCVRFLPQDVVSLLPQMFVSTSENMAFVERSIPQNNKSSNNTPKKSSKHYYDPVADINYHDRYFDHWYQKISNKSKQKQ